MRTTDGFEIENGSDIYVAYKTDDGKYIPMKVNMYHQMGHFQKWYKERENCVNECEQRNTLSNHNQ